MATRSRMAKFLGLGMLAALLAGDAAAQHPVLGANRPAPDPRYKGQREILTSNDHTFEMVANTRAERCAIRVVGWRETPRRNFVDTWVLGIETANRMSTAFMELRVIDETGAPLAIENPTFYLVYTGPTKDWHVLPMNADGYVRIEKQLRAMNERERLSFWTAVHDRVLRELAFTAPNGGGDSYVALIDGATDRQFEAFSNCACDTLDAADRNLMFCR